MDNSGLYKVLRIHAVQEEAPDFKTIVFENGHGIDYKAGQYLTLARFESGIEIRRSYSITSAPVLNEPLSIGVKRVANGVFSRNLVDNSLPGDRLLTTGSGGFFVLPENVHTYHTLFFFAAGSGITPVFPLVKTALHLFAHLSVILVYSNASIDKTVFQQPLQLLQIHYANRLHIEWLFSNAADLSKAHLHRDLLLQLLHQFGDPDWNNCLFYTCGPESYMRLCVYTLREQGIHPDQIKKETFHTAPLLKRDALPPDVTTHVAHIHIANHVYDVPVAFPDSILKAAKKQGINLPYSCEAGRCGNCVATCTSGNVWHSYNDVLTDTELKQGLMLTCVGHPVGGDVVLEI